MSSVLGGGCTSPEERRRVPEHQGQHSSETAVVDASSTQLDGGLQVIDASPITVEEADEVARAREAAFQESVQPLNRLRRSIHLAYYALLVHVTSQSTEAGSDGTPETHHTANVLEVVGQRAGTPPVLATTLDIVTLGGQLGDRSVSFSHEPELLVDSDYLVLVFQVDLTSEIRGLSREFCLRRIATDFELHGSHISEGVVGQYLSELGQALPSSQ
jgi:hypothetical protein